MPIDKYRLSLSDRGRVSCDGFGPKVGDVRLLKRTLDEGGNEVWAPRDTDLLNSLLAAHYQFPIDVRDKIEGLQAAAHALNKGDVAHACFVALFLRFPELPCGNQGEEGDDNLLRSLWWSGLLKADDEWNSKHPRTGKPPNPGWFDSVPKEPKPPLPAEDSGKLKWPSKEANREFRYWVKNNPPPRGLSHASKLELIVILLDELSKLELNSSEDLITAQLYASYDPPKTLEELRQRPQAYAAGYEQHHIVEQNDANRKKFGDAMIDDPDNIVWVPRLKHEKITADYNGRPSRDEPTFRETTSALEASRLGNVT